MLILENSELRVEVLDPVADRARLGPRFCWGGYVWQVHDRRAGALLSGPEWPADAPQVHNGQGLPESFRHSTTDGAPLLWDGAIGLAPGAGRLERAPDGNIRVVAPCDWEVAFRPGCATFRTRHAVGRWSYALERTIELHERRIVSRSRLGNLASTPLKLEWFAHPFFALERDGRLRASLPTDVKLGENPGYTLQDGNLALRRAFVGVHDGHLVHLGLPPGSPFTATLTHPRLASLRFATDFVPFKCVLWANGNTLSFEPFLALDLAPGETRDWTLTYDFGPAISSASN